VTSNADPQGTTELAAEIVAAFVSRKSLPVTELPALILSVDTALRRLATGTPATAALPAEKPAPAVSIRKSVTPDYLVCLDDGKQFKSLRHLRSLGMSPDEYRAKWGLLVDYPMVAGNYAVQRSTLAKSMGLGQASKTAVAKRGGKPKTIA
jgi:predicted transcriptional regulator